MLLIPARYLALPPPQWNSAKVDRSEARRSGLRACGRQPGAGRGEHRLDPDPQGRVDDGRELGRMVGRNARSDVPDFSASAYFCGSTPPTIQYTEGTFQARGMTEKSSLAEAGPARPHPLGSQTLSQGFRHLSRRIFVVDGQGNLPGSMVISGGFGAPDVVASPLTMRLIDESTCITHLIVERADIELEHSLVRDDVRTRSGLHGPDRDHGVVRHADLARDHGLEPHHRRRRHHHRIDGRLR